ncbi:S1C family serine protease [Actinokineospora spheciospongiae]|uniref:S1C family serine protease n=1 Tax=Actinokineospora spheciospongiae TaxID=909613 RepID=UPI000D93CDA8|nr:trypsin-like peptidase domain-containing protein [Actinokineospora spheciospongiae]PWW62310.1 trypsin-like peptidase [Actinokineospora spheciospongiae]
MTNPGPQQPNETPEPRAAWQPPANPGGSSQPWQQPAGRVEPGHPQQRPAPQTPQQAAPGPQSPPAPGAQPQAGQHAPTSAQHPGVHQAGQQVQHPGAHMPQAAAEQGRGEQAGYGHRPNGHQPPPLAQHPDGRPLVGQHDPAAAQAGHARGGPAQAAHPQAAGSEQGRGGQAGYGQQIPAFYQRQVLPQPRQGRLRRGAVALVAASVLGAGLLGGAAGAVIGSDGASTATSTTATSNAAPLSATTATDVSAIAAKVMPSVVQITVRLGNAEGIGSGVVLSADGRILTNNHVVEGARDITVTFSDGKTAPATVVGSDAGADLAVIQVQGVSGLTAATLGDSSAVRVGDQVIAIGSPAGLQGTVTTGIVSALDRDVNIGSEGPTSRVSGGSTVSYKAIQTDASINQGNSGGPLFDTAGRVIGINSAIYSPVSTSDGAAGSVGIGFSIPIDTAEQVISRIG